MNRALCTVLLGTALVAQDPKPQKPSTQEPAPSTSEMDEKAFAALHELTKEKAPPPLGTMVDVGKEKHYLSLPKEAVKPFPAVLLIHEWYGLNDHIKHWADRLAAEGYATLAVDLYGGKVATTNQEAAALTKVDPEKTVATLREAFEFLATDPRIEATKRGCMGWCFGGGWSLQLAIAEPKLDACVLYYGRLVDDAEKLKEIHAPVLGVFGTKDKSIPQERIDAFAAAMQKLGKPVNVLRYDAEHAFANPSGAHYDQKNAAAAWSQARAFLREHLTGPKKKEKAPVQPGK
jgi:carboxymethylenebutenolidase